MRFCALDTHRVSVLASSAFYQHTLAAAALFAGPGLHTGQHVRVAVRPAHPQTGLVFVRSDIQGRDNRIPARGEAVSQTRLGTVVSNAAGVSVSTIEHLMAALAALGVDNAVIELDGPEVPVMDGSSEPFVKLFDRVGLRRQTAPRRPVARRPIRNELRDRLRQRRHRPPERRSGDGRGGFPQ